ncbi:MAG TPA: RNA polymerase sigma-70 factor [Cyclobacteriaceae bacterium]|nr:RNA polymerase sigma-70 factor [Cyclobacteriaceae bacterium]
MPPLESRSDKELLGLLQSGNCFAFSEIYSRYWKKMFTVAANKTGNQEEAEELVQDIFVSLWERRESLEVTVSLNAYLAVSVKYQVIKILARRHLYRKYTRQNLDRGFDISNVTNEWLEFEELRERLESLVDNLPPKCRTIFKLSREQGLSQKQIAESCGISEKTVEAHLGKALKVLRSGLGAVLL